MARKRVSWELIVGSTYLYFDTRRRAVDQARMELAQGHPVELNRWEMIGEAEPTHAPVDLAPLVAAAVQEQERLEKAFYAPAQSLPAKVWAEVVRALSS